MKLAQVIGTVVATRKDTSLCGCKMLMIQSLTDDMKPSGEPLAAIDTVQAGPGDLVYWITGREAALALPDTFTPVDATIVGIVDSVNVENDGISRKKEVFGE